MDKLKLMTIIGTRPEIIKLSEIIKKCDEYFNHVIVHTGQNYDYSLNQVFFNDLDLRKPDYYLDVADNILGKTIGNIIEKSYELMMNEEPDAVLILGDTNSALSAICAKRLKIPIFHMEAGNRCFDENLPEEINRKIVDHIADVNLAYSENARRNLIAEGLKKEYTFVVGSPMAEILMNYKEKVEKSDVLEKLDLEKNEYILLSAHREENIDNESNFIALMESVNSIAQKYRVPIIYSLHPRSAAHIEKRNFKFHPLVKKMQPFGFFDYNCLQMKSFCVVSDSGTLAEESSILRFPCVSIRTSTERQEAVDKGNLIIGSISSDNVLQAIDLAIKMTQNHDFGITVPDYSDLNVSIKIIKIIQSYTAIINQMVWRK